MSRQPDCWRLLGRLLAFTLIAAGIPAIGAPILEFSQDGNHYSPFDAIEGRAKAVTYYDYHHQSGHPLFGTPKATSTAAMYWDEKRGALSLMIISGSADPKNKESGQVRYKVDNLPWSTFLALSDDPREYEYDKGQELTTPRFVYKNGTDGAVYGGLEKSSWVIKVSLSEIKGIKNWRLADPEGSANDFIALNMKKPLYLRYSGEDDADEEEEVEVVLPPPPPRQGGRRGVRSVAAKLFTPPSGPLPLLGPYKILPGSNNPGGGGGGGGGVGNPQPIPEPGGILLLAAMGSLLLGRGRRG